MEHERRRVKFHGTQQNEKPAIIKIASVGQFKCRTCGKIESCYGSRYCQNEFNPVSIVIRCSKNASTA
jgi:hypothetical protein